MEKYHEWGFLSPKIKRIMKLTLLFTLFCMIHISAATYAQTTLVSVDVKNGTFYDVVKQIENQSEYLFFYNSKEILNDLPVNLRVTNENIHVVLDYMVKKHHLSYKINDRHIFLTKENSNQQSKRQIAGVVTDEQDEPVIGANVIEKGTTNGVITDMDGKFTLSVSENAVLQVSFIGYIMQEVSTKNKSTVSVMLEEDFQALDEIVVVGFGTQKKLNLTGAVSAVSGKEITKRPVTNTATMLQGQVPGLRVTQGLGQPGDEAVSLRVRGLSTFSGSANPLVLINGIAGDMSSLDPSMIESVSVLKDAAASAIYGARAAHGVILITTKQGADAEGKVTIGYHGNFASHTPSRMYDLITNSVEYMELFNQAKINSGQGGLYPDSEIEKYRNAKGSVAYPNFDWLDYMFNPAFVHQHNLSLAGSVKNTTYNVALNFVDQDGTLRSNNYKKYNVTVDLTSKVTSFIKVGFYANLMKGERKYNGAGQQDAILSTMSQAPTYMPWLPDDGSGQRRWTHKAYDFESNNKNMVQIIENGKLKHTNNATDVNAQLWLEIDLFKGLKWYTKGAARQWNERDEEWRGEPEQLYLYHSGQKSEIQGDNGLTVKENRRFYTSLYSTLKYDYTTSNKAHDFSLMLGYS